MTETSDTEMTPFATAIETVRAGFRAMAEHCDSGDLAELIENAKYGDTASLIAPEIIGQLLMECLPMPDDSKMPVSQKAYWAHVAEHMGPDWIGVLRRTAAFMDRVESF